MSSRSSSPAILSPPVLRPRLLRGPRARLRLSMVPRQPAPQSRPRSRSPAARQSRSSTRSRSPARSKMVGRISPLRSRSRSRSPVYTDAARRAAQLARYLERSSNYASDVASLTDELLKENNKLVKQNEYLDKHWTAMRLGAIKHNGEIDVLRRADRAKDTEIASLRAAADAACATAKADLVAANTERVAAEGRQAVAEQRVVQADAMRIAAEEALRGYKAKVQADALLCIVCSNNARDTLFDSCGHMVMCGGCTVDLKERADESDQQWNEADFDEDFSRIINRCPMCRTDIATTTRVIIS